MAYDWMWIDTQLPKEIVKIAEKDLRRFGENTEDSRVFGTEGGFGAIKPEARSSKHSWIPESHWTAGFVMHYVHIVNQDNYLYDIAGLDGGTMQYGIYDVGGHYAWHADFGLGNCAKYPRLQQNGPSNERASYTVQASTEYVRKLSFSLQLTDPSEYEGGDLEIIGAQGESTVMPKEQGRIIFFDSRIVHRVTPVTKGQRRSLVGWIVGPRWK